MKRIAIFFCVLLLLLSMTACRNGAGDEQAADQENTDSVEGAENETKQEDDMQVQTMEQDVEKLELQSEAKEETEMVLNMQIGETLLTAALAQNSSVDALVEMLAEGPVTIHMNDYANMEKVGAFPESLPRNDEQISTDFGDLILYQGNSFVIYYDKNSWNFTRLGKINDVSQQELKDILGDGNVEVVLSIQSME